MNPSTEKSLEASQARFNSYITGLRLLITRAPQYAIPFWYSKEPMFWLPYGLFPYYAEWFLSLPRAPLGSVSIASWQVACTFFIRLVAELIGSVITLLRKAPQRKAGPKPTETKAPTEKITEKNS